MNDFERGLSEIANIIWLSDRIELGLSIEGFWNQLNGAKKWDCAAVSTAAIKAYQTALWSTDMDAAKDVGVVLALSADNEIEQLQHDELYNLWNGIGGRCVDISDYTHWQPLPKGPEVKTVA